MRMSPMVKLSVIIPHYNSVLLLEKLLSSIPKREEIQVIVVDDNSTEDTVKLQEMVAAYGNAELYKNHTGQNSAGCCRNIGVQHAKGEWLLFADADDYFVKDFYKIVEPYVHSEADIIYFTPDSVDLVTGEKEKRHEAFAGLVKDYLQKGDLLSEIKLRYCQEGPVSKLIRKSLVLENAIQFDCTRVANDVMFSIRCAYAAKSIQASQQVIYCITKGNGKSLTADKRAANFYTRLNVFVNKYVFLKKRLSREAWRQLDLLGSYYIKLAKAYELGTVGVLRVYMKLICNGVRIYVSRKRTVKEIIKKVMRR